jgi:hypothetical protein
MFLRPGRRPARLTSGLSATPVPIPTFRPQRPSGMHRDADRRHRHAQRGTSLTQVLSSRPWVKLSAAPSRSSVCPPPRVPCVSRHIKPDHARATIAPSVYARGLGSKVDEISLGGSPARPACRRPGLRSAFTQNLRCASNEAPAATHRSRFGTLPPEALYSWCARAAERARRAHPGSLRESRSRRRHACSGVLPGCRARHIPPRRPATWHAIHPLTPGGRYSSPAPPRLATNARRGTGAQPLRTEPGGRLATPTKPASPTPCGGPGDGRWVAGRVGTPQVNWL